LKIKIAHQRYREKGRKEKRGIRKTKVKESKKQENVNN